MEVWSLWLSGCFHCELRTTLRRRRSCCACSFHLWISPYDACHCPRSRSATVPFTDTHPRIFLEKILHVKYILDDVKEEASNTGCFFTHMMLKRKEAKAQRKLPHIRKAKREEKEEKNVIYYIINNLRKSLRIGCWTMLRKGILESEMNGEGMVWNKASLRHVNRFELTNMKIYWLQ